MKRVQFWFRNPLPEPAHRLAYETADVLVLGHPFLLDTWRRDLQRRGVRTIPYVSFYKAPDLTRIRRDSSDWATGSPAHAECVLNPFWKAVALDGRPGFAARDEQGRVRRPFENEGYAVGWDQTTPLHPPYRAACLDGIQALLDAGLDGVFLDNIKIQDRPPHAGQGDSKAIADAMRSLVKEAAALVHRHHPGALFIVNGGSGDPEVFGVADAYILESFLFSWAWDSSYFGSPGWSRFWEQLGPLRESPWSGVAAQPVALGYLGYSGKPLREECFSFAALAWILGMAVGDAGTALDRSYLTEFAGRNLFQGAVEGALRCQSRESASDWARDFYQLDPGQPLGGIRVCEQVLVREFENGVCAFNPTDTARTLTIPSQRPVAFEHACGVEIEVRSGNLTLWIAPFSGRVATWAGPPA